MLSIYVMHLPPTMLAAESEVKSLPLLLPVGEPPLYHAIDNFLESRKSLYLLNGDNKTKLPSRKKDFSEIII